MRFAVLDFGSYSTLLLVARPTPDGSLVEVQEEFRVTRLGEGTDRTGALEPEAVERTIAAARDFLARIQPGGEDPVAGIAAATSAVRDARNREIFLDACGRLLGAPPLLLTGEEEAKAVFLGAASDQPKETLLCTADIGGGSTEISIGRRDRCIQSRSIDIGSARLAQRFDLFDRVPGERMEQARQAVRKILDGEASDLLSHIPARGEPLRALASGGTATTYTSMRQELAEYRREAVHGFTDTEQEVRAACEYLFTLSSEERARLPGIEPGRAPVLPAGLIVVGEWLRWLGRASVTVTTRGLRFGLARRMQCGDLEPTWRR